jgi:hypothetical protein
LFILGSVSASLKSNSPSDTFSFFIGDEFCCDSLSGLKCFLGLPVESMFIEMADCYITIGSYSSIKELTSGIDISELLFFIPSNFISLLFSFK